MARITYAQVRSQASAYVKERLEKGEIVHVIIYKDGGGDFKMHELCDGAVICYTSFKAIVFANHITKEIKTVSSREELTFMLERFFKNTKFVYIKF